MKEHYSLRAGLEFHVLVHEIPSQKALLVHCLFIISMVIALIIQNTDIRSVHVVTLMAQAITNYSCRTA